MTVSVVRADAPSLALSSCAWGFPFPSPGPRSPLSLLLPFKKISSFPPGLIGKEIFLLQACGRHRKETGPGAWGGGGRTTRRTGKIICLRMQNKETTSILRFYLWIGARGVCVGGGSFAFPSPQRLGFLFCLSPGRGGEGWLTPIRLQLGLIRSGVGGRLAWSIICITLPPPNLVVSWDLSISVFLGIWCLAFVEKEEDLSLPYSLSNSKPVIRFRKIFTRLILIEL